MSYGFSGGDRGASNIVGPRTRLSVRTPSVAGMIPPLSPDEKVANGSEREVLETFPDLYRDIAVRKPADGTTGFDG
jgi:hypothetical protein